MKVFCILFCLFIACCIEIAIIVGAQWLSIEGPHWLMQAEVIDGQGNKVNGLLLLVGLVLTAANIASWFIVADAIDSQKK